MAVHLPFVSHLCGAWVCQYFDHAILLCALHHLLLHNRHWKILLRGGQYWLQPAVEIDLEQTLIALPSKNPLMQQPLVDSPQ